MASPSPARPQWSQDFKHLESANLNCHYCLVKLYVSPLHVIHTFDPMRKSIFTSVVALLISLSSFGQVPANPEDVSPLLIGEGIPNISIQNMNGEAVQMSEVFRVDKTVLLFYRGGWCPYCNIHLAAVGEVEKEILALGYQIVAISPDSPEYLKVSAAKEKFTYSLYSDSKNELAIAMGIAFKAPSRKDEKLLKRSDGNNKGILPVPCVFVINKSGVIIFEYISPDYKERMDAGLLLDVLKHFKK